MPIKCVTNFITSSTEKPKKITEKILEKFAIAQKSRVRSNCPEFFRENF